MGRVRAIGQLHRVHLPNCPSLKEPSCPVAVEIVPRGQGGWNKKVDGEASQGLENIRSEQDKKELADLTALEDRRP